VWRLRSQGKGTLIKYSHELKGLICGTVEMAGPMGEAEP
jgi:hypothetical protein